MDRPKLPMICAVPWNHFHVTALQRFGVCCLSDTEDGSSKTFEEHWNSQKMKDLRVKMLEGRLDETICRNCINCNNTEVPYYVWQNFKAEPFVEEILKKTSITGKTTYLPRTLDIRTDLCNLKCRMCSDSASTSIRQERIKAKIKVIPRGDLVGVEDMITDEHASILTQLTWAGGEPFMSPIHWKIMDQLLRLVNTGVNLFYNSNMTFPGNTLQKSVDLLQKFPDVVISASLDGTGEDVEYIREGIDYQKFLDHIEFFKREAPHVKLSMGYTATSLGLLTLDKVVDVCTKYDMSFEGRKSLLISSAPLSIDVVKTEVIHECLEQAVKAAQGTKNELVLKDFAEFIKDQHTPIAPDIEYLNFQERYKGKAGYFMQRMNGLMNL
jgi:organic radical activating enzyme